MSGKGGGSRWGYRQGGRLWKREVDELVARVTFQDTLNPDPCFLEASVVGLCWEPKPLLPMLSTSLFLPVPRQAAE